MTSALPALPPEADTIAELRELYRAAEARAARLRLLSTIGRELALARAETIDDALQRCTRDLAYFLGCSAATFARRQGADGIPIRMPGGEGQAIAWLFLAGCPSLDAIADPEDREICRMCLDLFAVTIDRFAREDERAQLIAALTEREQRLELLVGRFFFGAGGGTAAGIARVARRRGADGDGAGALARRKLDGARS